MGDSSLKNFFEPKTVAIVGASADTRKVGHVILKNFIDNFHGKTYPVNPKHRQILNTPCYASVRDIPGKLDLVVIAVPAPVVPQVMMECIGKTNSVIIISGGFSEVGNKELEEKVKEISRLGGMRIVGPNCLGVFDTTSLADTLFLPWEKLQRPKKGGVSFITQSGAVGSAVLDWLSYQGVGVARFLSYGNAVDVNEVDALEYLANDKSTKVICFYLEGTKDGRALMKAARKVVKRKPVIVIKAGRTSEGTKAVSSHTGSLAGEDIIYDAAFRQSGIIRVDSITEMFDYAKALSMQTLPKGGRVQIVTNGGGFGVLATDEVISEGLSLARMSDKTKRSFRMPTHIVVGNPFDLTGDADTERYKQALKAVDKDKSVDAILCILLFQTASLDDKVIDVIAGVKKPIAVCSAGGRFTQDQARKLESKGVPTYDSPTRAAQALAALARYSGIKKKL